MVVFDILSWICLVIGSFFAVVGGIGIYRLPDFYSRLHAGGITDTMGAGLIMIGLMFQAIKVGLASGFEAGPWIVLVKLVMILFFLLIISPSATHALAQAAWTNDLEPQLFDNEDAPTK